MAHTARSGIPRTPSDGLAHGKPSLPNAKVFAPNQQPHLLKQMNMMLEQWKVYPPSTSNALTAVDKSNGGGSDTPGVIDETDEKRHVDLANIETCRSVLAIYDAAAGQYQPLLTKLHKFIFETLESVTSGGGAGAAATGGSAGAQRHQMTTFGADREKGPDHIDGQIVEQEDKRSRYAFGRVEAAEGRMRSVIDESRERQKGAEDRIKALDGEVAKLRSQLDYALHRNKKKDAHAIATEPAELDKERHILDLQKEIDELKEEIKSLEDKNETLRQQKKDLRDLNANYARQAVELAARVRVYAEHNEKFAELLSMQQDDNIETKKENEQLRAELMDLNRFHQLRDNLEGESGSVGQTIELRPIRYGLGHSTKTPAHLRHTGLLPRNTVPREAALTIISDILLQRFTPPPPGKPHIADFDVFIQKYMVKRHSNDAVAWCYSLDDACRFYDSDCNLLLFGLVSRKQIAEYVFKEIATDLNIFVEACQVLDRQQHGDLKHTVPVIHVLGLLIEMFPSYRDPAFKRIMEHLQATLTTNSHAHYGMLFPNRERDEMTVNPDSTFAMVELRPENIFSRTFKELIIDDIVVTTQIVEDLILNLGKESMTESDVRFEIGKVYETQGAIQETISSIRHYMQEYLGTTNKYNITVSRSQMLTILRQKAVLRRGVFRPEQVNTEQRLQSLVNVVLPKSDLQIAHEMVEPVDYRAILSKVSCSRRSFMKPGDFDDDAKEDEEEDRMFHDEDDDDEDDDGNEGGKGRRGEDGPGEGGA